MNKILVTNTENNQSEWLELPIEEERLTEIFCALSLTFNEEENDYDGDMGIFIIEDSEFDISNLRVSKNDSIEYLNEFIQAYEYASFDEQEEIEALLEYDSDWERAYDIFQAKDYIAYHNMTMEDLAEQIVNEGLFGDIPDSIINYIDYEAIANDLRHDYYECDNGIILEISSF